MTDDVKTPPKVVSLRTRKEFEPEKPVISPDEAKTDEGLVPDEDLVKVIEVFLEQAKAGRISGFVGIAWNEKYQAFDRATYMPHDSAFAIKNIHSYIGALKVIGDDLSDHVTDMVHGGPDEDDEDFDDDGNFVG